MAIESPTNRITMLKRWLPLIVWAALIFVGSSIPQLSNEKIGLPPGSDKVVHFVEYLVLALLCFRGFGAARLGESVSIVVVVVAICLGVGGIDEYYQRYVPGRNSSLLDFSADVGGVAVGTLVGIWRGKVRTRHAEGA